MAPKISTVIGGLRIALQALASKMGVTLHIEGDQAYTNGNIIVIPTLPADDHEAAILARGYVDHEAAHVALTDFSIEMPPWTNIIEDVRIEKEQGKIYPGCAANLKTLAALLARKGKFRGTPAQPLSMLMSWACCRARTDVLGQPLGKIAKKAEDFCRKALGDHFCDLFAALVDRIGSCSSTADCDGLAKEIEALIDNPPDPPPPPPPLQGNRQKEERDDGGKSPQSGNDPSDRKSDPSESDEDKEGASGKEGKPADPDRTDTGGEPPAAGDGKGSGNDPGEADADEGGSGTSPRTRGAAGGSDPLSDRQKNNLKKLKVADAAEASQRVDLGQMVSAMLGREHEEGERNGTLEEIPDTSQFNVGAGSGPGDQKTVEGDMGLDDARRKTSRLRAQLAGLLQAVRIKHAYPKRVGFRIDGRSVHLIGCRTPDTRVFASRRIRDDDNTAIVLLTDRSGSMKDNNKIRVALQGAFVTAEALELLPGVACAVGAFPWGRDIVQLKAFGAKPRAGRFNVGASGGTPMAEALLWSGMLLTHRQETRKIVIAMTDGAPDDHEKTERAVARLRACGIEVYGIGILDAWIESWLKESSSVIRQIDDLPAALIGLLKEALITRLKAA
ncbi:VWA domain-containing protein [Geobacter sp.]|uniref:VWA domain-containing protein n=1 Tax=Geobacter sp. TaxID=46610 RepID=UPI00262BE19E|nr:VWA domain-containing protein [Geobacter sp.]